MLLFGEEGEDGEKRIEEMRDFAFDFSLPHSLSQESLSQERERERERAEGINQKEEKPFVSLRFL